MNTEHRLLKKLAQTRRGRTYLYPLLGSGLILAIFWIGLWRWSFAFSRSMEIKIAILGMLVALLAFRLILRATRRNMRETAADIDGSLASNNQLEAMVELKDSDHPLRSPQQEHVERELETYKPAPWALLLSIAVLLLCVELVGVIPYFFQHGNNHTPFGTGKTPPGESRKPPIKKSDSSKPRKNEFAELKLTKPEPEIRMKPMDEVAWEGTGRSSNGFNDLALAIYLNGEAVTNLPLDKALGKSGKIEIAGSFFLDEINAEPYDVVSYFLTAHSEVNGDNAKKVISIPQFIEVRPFREDAEVLPPGKGIPGDGKSFIQVLSFIHKVLQFELVLNKAVFAARTADLAQNDPVFIEQIGILKNEQQQLQEELDTFLTNVDPALLSPNMLTSLRAAEDYMEAAGTQLATIAPGEKRTDTP